MGNGTNKNSTVVMRLLLILLAALALFGALTYYNRTKTERFNAGPPTNFAPSSPSSPYLAPSGSAPGPVPLAAPSKSAMFGEPMPLEPVSNEKFRGVPGDVGGTVPIDPFPQDRVSPEDLLPKDAANSKWAQVNPAGQGDLKDMNLLTAGYHMGVNTQGQSLRNASHDLRSEPVNPRYKVSIWNNATIEGDLNRRPLE